ACAILPLSNPGVRSDSKPAALLVLEQYSAPFENSTRELAPQVAEHAGLALVNARDMAVIPGHPVWIWVGRRGWLVRHGGGEGWLSRIGGRVAVAAILVAAILGALVMIPADVRISARGELQPVVRHDVFAPRDGVVTAIHVDHGKTVAAGEALLEMRSPEL